MIKPEDMTLLQNMYALCHLGVTLSAKQKNKDTMDLFSKFGSMMVHAVILEAKYEKIDENEIIEFMQLMPLVANELVGITDEDKQFMEQVVKEHLKDIIDVNELFGKESKTEFVMSEEEFNKFMNGYKKEGNINAS